MREMKDSGVEWIGEIPISWVQKKVKYIVSISSGSFISKEQYEDDGKYPVIGANGEIGRTNKCNNQEYVITTGRVGTIGTAHKVQKSWITDNVLIMSDIKANIDYFRYAISSFDYQHMTAGTAMPLITATKINNQVIPFPSRLVQQKIAAHLDRKCTQIDALISNAQQQIEKLKAYKQSVITETVTKGLDPDVKMKDSGVEWIGEIPEHWEVIRLKFLLQYIIDCPHETPNYSFDGEYYVIRTADEDYGFLRADEQMYRLDEKEYKHRIRRLSLDKDDIVYGREGERWGLACIVPESNKYCLGQRMMQFRCNEHIVPMFIMWALNSKNIYVQGCFDTLGSTSPHVNISTIINYEIPIPSYEEQNKLASFLEEKCSRIDKLIALKQQKIEKLQQYKKSLIYEYVTGKKEV